MIKIGKQSITRTNHHEEEEALTPSDLPKYLGDTLELEEGVTFKRIFDLIIMNRKFFDVAFASVKGFYTIETYLHEYLKDDDDTTPSEIDYLEVYYVYDYWEYKKEVTVEPYSAFHGICNNYTDEFQKEPCVMPIGVGFTPINQLKKYEIKINNKFHVGNFDVKQKPAKYVTFVEGKTSMRLFDFISAILHEISWHGSPTERQERVDDLNETVERIKSGEEEMFEWIIGDDGKHFLKDKEGNLKPFFDDDEEDSKED